MKSYSTLLSILYLPPLRRETSQRYHTSTTAIHKCLKEYLEHWKVQQKFVEWMIELKSLPFFWVVAFRQEQLFQLRFVDDVNSLALPCSFQCINADSIAFHTEFWLFLSPTSFSSGQLKKAVIVIVVVIAVTNNKCENVKKLEPS